MITCPGTRPPSHVARRRRANRPVGRLQGAIECSVCRSIAHGGPQRAAKVKTRCVPRKDMGVAGVRASRRCICAGCLLGRRMVVPRPVSMGCTARDAGVGCCGAHSAPVLQGRDARVHMSRESHPPQFRLRVNAKNGRRGRQPCVAASRRGGRSHIPAA